jgi:hypothetical protein
LRTWIRPTRRRSGDLDARGSAPGGNFCDVLRTVIIIALGTVVLSGCAGPDVSGPERTATTFAQAISTSNGELACTLLSAEVSSSLAGAAGIPCSAAVLKKDLPTPSAVRDAERFGHQALVTTDTDTVFLSEFPDGWKIIGVGCQARDDKPYDCAVSGG